MKKILLVDDEPEIQLIMSSRLEALGYQVLIAKDGQEGLNMAREKHPDLILLDIVMPIMDGITMLRFLRRDEWGKNAPVMLLTNLNETEKISNSMDLEAFDYLIKTDWSLDNVVKKIKEKLEIK